jgi:hypothetical protein
MTEEERERWRRAAAALELREKAEWQIEMEALREQRRAERAAEAAKEAAGREAAMAIIKRGETEEG